jgi:hypothetical protein
MRLSHSHGSSLTSSDFYLGFGMYLLVARFVQMLKVVDVVCTSFNHRYYVMGFDFFTVD